MAADLTVKLEAENPCCKVWREKYSNLEKKRYALRQAVNILTPQIDTFQAENANLKKAYEEEQARAENEREGRLKESTARVSLENEISVLKSEITQVKQKASINAADRDQTVRLLQDRVSEREKEINRLKELLEKEKKRADTERKNAEGEKKKAAEMFKSIKAEKDEEIRIARTGGEKAEQYRLQLEIFKKEADEAKSKLASETMKFEQANKRLGEEKKKALKERKRADLEMAKAEEQRKLAEANGKKAVGEKFRADNFYQQLEENKQKLEELRGMHEFRNLASLGGWPDNKLNPESVKTKNRLQGKILNKEVDEHKSVLELLKESNKRFEVENLKAIKEKTLADPEMVKAEEQKTLADMNWKKAMQDKCCADQLSQQLQNKKTIEELQKKIHELQPSRKLVERSSVTPVKTITSENENVKLLKKELKFEKKQAKHAKRVAKLEKSRSHILQQELGHLKLEFDQFSNRLDRLNKSLFPSTKGIDDLEKNEWIAYMQRLNMMKKLCSLEPTQAPLQSEIDLGRPSCMDMDASYPLRKSLQHPAQLLPMSGGNFDESISGINSKLESPLGCSNWKMLQTSAINSSMASFSDGQLMGSQEKGGALSVTTSTKLVEENLNAQPTRSNLSGEVTKMRCCEKSAVVAENNVKIVDSDDVVRGCDHSRKRKWLLDSAEPIEYLYSKGKKLCVQIEENLSLLHGMLYKRIIGNPLEEVRCLAPNLQCIPRGKLHGLHKKSKVSPEEVDEKHFCVSGKREKTEKSGQEACLEDSSDLETMASFEDVADGDYMKLLNLDDAADEQRYRMATERPVSPSLPIIDFDNRQIFDVNSSEALVEECVYKEVSTEENLLPKHSFDVIDVEIESNKLKHNAIGTSHNMSPQKNVAPVDSVVVNGNDFWTVEAGDASPQQIQDSGLVVGMSNLPRSRDEEVKFPLESEFGSAHDTVPKYCVVSPNMRDCNIISRIFKSTKNCIARCGLLSQTEWVVPKILLALRMEENLLLVEKVCVFFTSVLLNLSTVAPRKFLNCLNMESTLWLDSFSGHIRAVMSNVETRSMLADFDFLDELLSLIEEFLIDGRVLVYTNISSETLIECDTRINFLLDGVPISLSYEVSSAALLVAGSIILASICAAIDEIGFVCETSYNIFRRHACDSSLVLSILHVFAYLCGQKLFGVTKYGLMVIVFKSIVRLLEGVNFSDPAATCSLFVSKDQFLFHPWTKCPFSNEAVSIDTVTSLLLKLIQNNTGLEITNNDVIKSFDMLNSEVLYASYKSELSSSHEGSCATDMNFDASCCLEKYEMPNTQSHSVASMRLCHLTDILSLVELVACNMRWDWTSIKMIPELLKILELCVSEDFAAAIVVLIGQLGRLGVDAGGYEDKGVENLICNLSTLLNRYASMKAGLHLQIATVTALLGLLPHDFVTLIRSNVKIQVTASQSLLADSMRNWFSLLSKEQQDFSVRLLQTSGAKQK